MAETELHKMSPVLREVVMVKARGDDGAALMSNMLFGPRKKLTWEPAPTGLELRLSQGDVAAAEEVERN